MPDKALARRRTLGVRIPDHAVARAVAEALGAPLLVASVHDDCETEYTTDPELIAERYGDRIDLVIDGGPGNSVPTTVVDLTQDEPLVLREGAASWRSGRRTESPRIRRCGRRVPRHGKSAVGRGAAQPGFQAFVWRGRRAPAYVKDTPERPPHRKLRSLAAWCAPAACGDDARGR